MTVMMIQNITWCHLQNQAVVWCTNRTPDAAELFSLNYFKVHFVLSFWFFLVGYLIPLIFKLISKSSILNLNLEANSEAYPEPYQTSKVEVFA